MDHKLKQSISKLFWKIRVKWDLTFQRNRIIIEYPPTSKQIAMAEFERKRKEEEERIKRIYEREKMYGEVIEYEKICIAFRINDPEVAYMHINMNGAEVVKDYGNYAYDHFMSDGKNGWRKLLRCKTCHGMYLVQKTSENDKDGSKENVTYFPVKSIHGADELCIKYDGMEILYYFDDRFLDIEGDVPNWRLAEKLTNYQKERIKSKYEWDLSDK